MAAQRDPATVATVWAAAVVLAVGVAVALMMAGPWDRTLPRWVPVLGERTVPGWFVVVPSAGAALVLLLQGAGHTSMLFLGDLASPSDRWAGLFWGPWFLLGGVLFLVASLRFVRKR